MATRAYARASTGKQVLSPILQIEEMLRYAHANNLGKPFVYTDKETTSKIPFNDRDAGGKLMAELRKGDHFLIFKLDRAFRNMRECVNFVEDCVHKDIHVHVMNLQGGAIDITRTMGRMFIYMAAMFAELEREMICERTKDALNSLKRQERAVGRHAPWGFVHGTRRDHNSNLIHRTDKAGRRVPAKFTNPCPEERAVGRRIIQMYDVGMMEYREIAEKLNEQRAFNKLDLPWTFHGVFRAIHSEKALQLKEQVACEPKPDLATTTAG